MGATSAHFSAKELSCPCCSVNGMQQSALDLFEDIRAKAESVYGMGRVRMIPTSGFRCEAHNADPKVGGSPNSQHPKGTAADLVLQISQDRGKGKQEWVTVHPGEWEPIARKAQALGGIGRDDERLFIHCDCRQKMSNVPAQWCYSGGKEVAYYKYQPKGTIQS